MESAYDKYYEKQPGAVKVIVVAGLAGIGYLIYRSIKNAQEKSQASQAAKNADKELAALAALGVYPSYNLSQFDVFVNTLVQAMTGCATDEDMIYGVFRQLKNEADIRQLIKSFSVQYYQPCAWTSPVSYAIWQFNDHAYGGDLATWLGYDLSSGEISKINSILSGNGISYTF